MRLKQISKRSLAIILSVLMILSTLMVGTITTVNSATTDANTSGTNITGGTKLYLKPGVWDASDAKERYAAYFFGSSSQWVSMTAVANDTGVYEVTAPAGTWTNVIFGRMDGSSTTNNWNNCWNQTDDLTYDGSKDLYSVPSNNAWNKPGNGSNWSKYTPTATEYTVTIGQSSNGSFSATYGNTTVSNVGDELPVDAGKDIILTANPDPGYEIDDYTVGTSTVNASSTGTTTTKISSNVTITANFTPIKYKITDTSNSQYGNVQIKVNDVVKTSPAEYSIGDKITLTAISTVDGYAAKSLTVDGVLQSSTIYEATMNDSSKLKDFNVSATFDIADENAEYAISPAATTNGSFEIDKTKAKANETVTISIKPDSGYIVNTVTATTASGSSVQISGTGNTRTFVMPPSAVTVNVTFTANTSDYKYYARNKDNGNLLTTNQNISLMKGYLNNVEYAYLEVPEECLGYDKLFSIAYNGTHYAYNSEIYKDKTFGSDLIFYNHHGYPKANPNTSTESFYIIVYYPETDYKSYTKGTETIYVNNTSTNPIVVASTFLPGQTVTSKFTVSVDQGKDDYFMEKEGQDASRGETTLHTGNKSDSFSYDDNTVTFTTVTKKVTNTNLGVTDMYIYRVYGYSILITYTDGTKEVVSIDEHAITSTNEGTYTASYTFEPRDDGTQVKSVIITPIFTSSEKYAALKGIGFTTVYLKATPGSNLISNTLEPKYYTWRIVQSGQGYTQYYVTSEKDGKMMQSLPEGWWNGQKMLYVGNGMYKAIVEDKLKGIVFTADNTTVQTLDYDEFIKLQELGYKKITFEPKTGITNGVAATLNNNYGSKGNYKYAENKQECSFSISETLTNDQFELDVNIEGYYVDVFGNKLEYSQAIIDQYNVKDKYIKESDLHKYFDINNTHEEATALLQVMKAPASGEQALYGARFGLVPEIGFYGMSYASRVYYFEVNDKKTYMVSQQVSGYGAIEGAYSPNDISLTNAQYAANNNITLKYALDVNGKEQDPVTFTDGYDLIPSKFVGVPFLVSYQAATKEAPDKQEIRIDGKWYYQSETPKIRYEMKTGLMDNTNKVIMDDATKEIKVNSDGGSAIFSESGLTTITVEQDSTATLIATPNKGYRFVGFYEPNGTRISTNNNHVITITSLGTVFAVFQKLETKTLVVTNDIYRGNNPKDGGGKGEVTVKINVYSDANRTKLINSVSGKTNASVQIEDGQYFEWIITGKPTGLDEFIAFRAPDAVTNEYAKLDVVYAEYGYGYQELADGVHSYTSAFMEMKWSNYGTNIDSLTIINATDFNKTSYKVNLHYCYLNRYNQEREYIVSNIELTEDEMNKGFKPSKDTIDNNAPYINEVFKNCTWNVNEDLSNVTQTGADYYLDAVHEDRLFKTFISTNGIESNKREDAYNTLITIEAPKTNKSDEEFMYWVQYRVDSNGKVVGNKEEENIISYYNKVSLRVTFDSKLVAVYNESGEVIPDFATNVQKPEYTREQYTENGVNYDYIYSDLLLQFDISQKLGNGMSFGEYYAANSNAIKFGIVLESNVAYKYDGTSTMINPTPTKDYLEQTITNLASNTGSGESNGDWSVTEEDTPEYNYYYNLYDLTDNADKLSDLGRVDYIFRFNNTETNRGIVYNVYSYILYTDPNTSEKKTLYLSNPVVMNIYSIGTQENEKG